MSTLAAFYEVHLNVLLFFFLSLFLFLRTSVFFFFFISGFVNNALFFFFLLSFSLSLFRDVHLALWLSTFSWRQHPVLSVLVRTSRLYTCLHFFFSLLEPSRWGTAFTLCKSMKVGLFFFTCLWRRSTKRWKKKNSRAKKKERRKTRKYKRETDPVIRWSKATNSHSHTHTHTHTHLWPVQC